MSKDDGGPAFPERYDYDKDHTQCWGGMTLRDYFAAEAIRCFSLDRSEVQNLLDGLQPRHDLVAKFCYELADAMLAERNRDQGEDDE